MRHRFNTCLILGILLIVFFGIPPWGVRFNMGIVSFNLGRLIAFWILMGILCSYLAYKKNKSPERAFLIGSFLTLLTLFYYLVCKSGVTEEEKEIHEWELEKKYKKMLREKKIGGKKA